MPVTTDTSGHAIFQAVTPSLKVGAASGIGGFLLGGGVGILKSAHPGLVAVFTGTQFFVLGSTFVCTREVLLETAFREKSRRAELVSSTAAGALAGAAAGAFYGRVNSVAGACVVGTLSHLGQRYGHTIADRPTKQSDPRPVWDRLADSRWVPFRPISNSQYETMLVEKLVKVEAEISIIDEKLSTLRKANETPPNGLGRSESS